MMIQHLLFLFPMERSSHLYLKFSRTCDFQDRGSQRLCHLQYTASEITLDLNTQMANGKEKSRRRFFMYQSPCRIYNFHECSTGQNQLQDLTFKWGWQEQPHLGIYMMVIKTTTVENQKVGEKCISIQCSLFLVLNDPMRLYMHTHTHTHIKCM